jgi:hypothetical protein
MLLLYLNHFDFRRSRASHHICRSAAAGERYDKVRFTFVDHLLIPDRTGGVAVRVPVGFEFFDLDPISHSPFICQKVSAARPAMDKDRIRRREPSSGDVLI